VNELLTALEHAEYERDTAVAVLRDKHGAIDEILFELRRFVDNKGGSILKIADLFQKLGEH